MNFILEERPEPAKRFPLTREWIIFAISMGLGGHIVLGIVLHAPDAWPWDQAGRYALLVGFSVYATVLLSRAVARIVHAAWFRKSKPEAHSPGP